MIMSFPINLLISPYKQIYSTKSALLSIKNEIHLATAVGLLDQSAVFYTIDHGMLIECLTSLFVVEGAVLN